MTTAVFCVLTKPISRRSGGLFRTDLIDAGIDVLHPLQAQAVGMSADELSQYKNDSAFVGGIDAQPDN